MSVRALRLLAMTGLLSLATLSACARSPQPVAGLPDFADLVDTLSPSVVNISTTPREEVAAGGGSSAAPMQPDARDHMPDWMKKFLEQHPNAQQAPNDAQPGDDAGGDEGDQSPEDNQSLGSGFVLWQDGYIITNTHVVKDAQEITVRLADRREMSAQVVGMDDASDIALLKIDAKDLPAVKIADVGKLRVGEWVMAIGSPFGFDYSVTAGIVSAKGRSLFTEQYVPFIQTDAAINPGNSGGPLFNLKGEVVGVNSQIYSQTGGNSGIAFAIPADVVIKVAQQLKDRGRVTRGWLGVVVQEVTRELAKSFDLPKAEGALVARVVPGSPSEKAGIKAGDVILAFNGQPLALSRDLPPRVGDVAPGQKVPLKVLRDGKQQVIQVEIAELPPETAEAAPAKAVLPLGLALEPLSDADRRDAKVADGGVLVTRVSPGVAQKAGVREGDIILSLSGHAVQNPAALRDALAKLKPGTSVPLLVQRNGNPLFLALDIPDKP